MPAPSTPTLYPDILERVRVPLLFLAPPPESEVPLELVGGTLLNHSGLPVLMPAKGFYLQYAGLTK